MRIDKKRLSIRFRRFDGTVARYPLHPEKCTPQSARLRSITPMLHCPLKELRIRIKLVAVADNRREAWFWRIILGGIHEIRGLQDRRLSSTGWFLVAEIPAIAGCYALMDTREAALAELSNVFAMIQEEYREKGLTFPATPMTS